jgi:uncharacterized protein
VPVIALRAHGLLKTGVNSTLTIVGASTRAATQSAVRAGWHVHAGDLFADEDLRQICHASRVDPYPQGISGVVDGPQPGAWMYCGALENSPSLVAQCAKLRPLWGNGADVLRRVRNPGLVNAALTNAGLRSPQVHFGATPPPGVGWVQKPLRSAAGVGIELWKPGANEASTSEPNTYLQQHVQGSPYSAMYVSAAGRAMLLAVTRQLIGEPWTGTSGFRYCGSIGPLDLSPDAMQSFERIGDVLSGEFGLSGAWGVDAIVNDDGVWPLEVNPRYTASMELLDWACETSAIELHVDACRDQRASSERPVPRRVCGKAIVYARRSLNFEHSGQIGPCDGWPTSADIPAMGTAIEQGSPILTVLAEGADEQQVLERLQARAQQVRVAIGDEPAWHASAR